MKQSAWRTCRGVPAGSLPSRTEPTRQSPQALQQPCALCYFKVCSQLLQPPAWRTWRGAAAV